MKRSSTFKNWLPAILLALIASSLALQVKAEGEPSLEELKADRVENLNEQAKKAAAQKKARAEANRKAAQRKRTSAHAREATVDCDKFAGDDESKWLNCKFDEADRESAKKRRHFDCRKATSVIDKGICSSKQLTLADNNIVDVLGTYKNSISDQDYQMVMAEERQWLQYRDKYMMTHCVKNGRVLNVQCAKKLLEKHLEVLIGKHGDVLGD